MYCKLEQVVPDIGPLSDDHDWYETDLAFLIGGPNVSFSNAEYRI